MHFQNYQNIEMVKDGKKFSITIDHCVFACNSTCMFIQFSGYPMMKKK